MTEVIFNNIAYALKQYIETATHSLKIAVAWFTNEELFDVVLSAIKRGVSVELIILDDAINRNELALDFSQFITTGGKLYFSNKRKMHNKFCILDETLVLTGSYNWTYYAENLNWENIVAIDDINVVTKYLKEFEEICKTLLTVNIYTPLRLSEMDEALLYDNYTYLSNDLCLKSKYAKDCIESINRENKRNSELEEFAKERAYDYRGIPLLKKEFDTSEYRLINIHIESIPPNMPNANRKYILAQLISNNRFAKDMWIHIIDEEYVNEMMHYFHIHNGGLLEDHVSLPQIPIELYTPGLKYHFVKAECYFKGSEEHQKYDSQGHLLPHKYKSFNLYARFNKHCRDYVGYKSLSEQFSFIVESLFSPNRKDDIDTFLSFGGFQSGLHLCNMDDLYRVELFLKECNLKHEKQIHLKELKEYIGKNPHGLYVQWENYIVKGIFKGLFINHKDVELADQGDKGGEWFLFKDPSFYGTINDWRGLVNSMRSTFNDGKVKGIIVIWYMNNDKDIIRESLISAGFKAEMPIYKLPTFQNQPNIDKNIWQYRYTF